MILGRRGPSRTRGGAPLVSRGGQLRPRAQTRSSPSLRVHVARQPRAGTLRRARQTARLPAGWREKEVSALLDVVGARTGQAVAGMRLQRRQARVRAERGARRNARPLPPKAGQHAERVELIAVRARAGRRPQMRGRVWPVPLMPTARSSRTSASAGRSTAAASAHLARNERLRRATHRQALERGRWSRSCRSEVPGEKPSC